MGVLQTVVFVCLAGGAFASVAIGRAMTHPDHPGRCWNPKENVSYAVGEQWQEANCVRVTCTDMKSTLYVEYATCGAMGLDPGCKTVQDLSLPYPSCCPVPSCPETQPDVYKGELYDEFTNWITEYYDTPIATA